MTNMTHIRGPSPGLVQRLRFWLPRDQQRRAPAAPLHALSDHILRDIGLQRVELDHIRTRTLNAAMWLSR